MRSLIRLGIGAVASLLLSACAATGPSHPSSISQAAALNRADDDVGPSHRFRVASVSPETWDQLRTAHTGNVKLRWPDGRLTQVSSHTPEDLDRAFAFAPDHVMETHPVKLDYAGWTGEAGTLSGTFTQPLKNGDGTVTAPTGRHFKVWLVTVSHWTEGAKDQEYVFWDSGAQAKSLAL
jgi:hypothetical protein